MGSLACAYTLFQYQTKHNEDDRTQSCLLIELHLALLKKKKTYSFYFNAYYLCLQQTMWPESVIKKYQGWSLRFENIFKFKMCAAE